MLVWMWLLGGSALIIAIGACVLSMSRAERRARRSLYRTLGLGEATVDFLMERNRDVLGELTFVRAQGETAVTEAMAAAAERSRNVAFLRPALRLVRAESHAAAPAPAADAEEPAWRDPASDDRPQASGPQSS